MLLSCVSVLKSVNEVLDIINDKWSNCGSDDSSCKY